MTTAVRRTVLIGTSIAFLVASSVTTGCSEASQDASSSRSESTTNSPGPALSDLQAARAFVAAIRRYERERLEALEGKPMPNARSCLDLQSVDSKLRGRIAVLETQFTRLVKSKLTAPLFENLATELDEIPTNNESLRTVARSVMSVAANVSRRMRAADVDFCRELAAWQRDAWSDAGYNELINAASTRFGVDRNSYEQSVNAASSQQSEIMRIEGIEPEEVLSITASPRFV